MLLFITIHLSSDGKKNIYIFKFLVLSTKLNQVSSSLKKIKLLLCKSVLMRTEPADSDKWEWHQREHVSKDNMCMLQSSRLFFTDYPEWLRCFLRGLLISNLVITQRLFEHIFCGWWQLIKEIFYKLYFYILFQLQLPVILLYWWNNLVTMQL